MAVLWAFGFQESLPALRRDFEGEIFHQVMDCSDAEIKKFSVPSLDSYNQ